MSEHESEDLRKEGGAPLEEDAQAPEPLHSLRARSGRDGDVLCRRPSTEMGEAWEGLRRKLFAVALRMTGGDHAAAEDYVQETYLLARSCGTVPRTPGYFFQILKRLIWQAGRRRAPSPLTWEPVAEDSADSEDSVERFEERQRMLGARLGSCLERLCKREREVLVAVFFRGLSCVAVAAEWGIQPGAVRRYKSDGLCKLRAMFGDDELARLCGTDG